MDIQLLARLFSNTALTKAVFFALVTTCMLTGCAGTPLTATAYQPADGVDAEGYTSHRLDAGKYKIMYRANSATSEATMASYVNQRAAEITKEHGYQWYRVIDSEAVDMSGITEQQVLTAAPATPAVNGAVTGEVDTNDMPTNQRCSLSGCENATPAGPVTNADNGDSPSLRFYTMTVQLGGSTPVPDDAIVVK